MKTPLTKEQRAEMRERFMLGEYTVEDVQDVFERLEEADLATAKLATSEICECVYDDSWKTSQDVVTGACVYNKKCPNCTNGVVYSDERARELLERLKRAEEDSALLEGRKSSLPPPTNFELDCVGNGF